MSIEQVNTHCFRFTGKTLEQYLYGLFTLSRNTAPPDDSRRHMNPRHALEAYHELHEQRGSFTFDIRLLGEKYNPLRINEARAYLQSFYNADGGMDYIAHLGYHAGSEGDADCLLRTLNYWESLCVLPVGLDFMTAIFKAGSKE